MDAKTNANIINAVANGTQVPCPNCNTMNEADSRFCMTCGAPLVRAMKPNVQEEQPVPQIPVTEVSSTEAPFATVNAVNEPEVPFSQINSDNTDGVPFAPVDTNNKADLPFTSITDTEPESPITPVVQEEKVAAPFTPIIQKRKGVAFTPASEPVVQEPEEVMPLKPIQNEITTEEVMEAVSAFAEGLPEWDIVPPQVAVRRKNK